MKLTLRVLKGILGSTNNERRACLSPCDGRQVAEDRPACAARLSLRDARQVPVSAGRRNRDRFPDDFMFQLREEEFSGLRHQIDSANLRSQFATSSWGGRRYRPYAFTEQGVAMLSTVLRSKRAAQVNIEILRAFVRLRRMLASNEELARKLAALERKYDAGWRLNSLSNIMVLNLLTPVKESTLWLGGWSRKIRQTIQ